MEEKEINTNLSNQVSICGTTTILYERHDDLHTWYYIIILRNFAFSEQSPVLKIL